MVYLFFPDRLIFYKLRCKPGIGVQIIVGGITVMRFLIINGPNLNRLGMRDPVHYGSMTLKQLNVYVKNALGDMGIAARFFHSSYEGAIVDCLHKAQGRFDGILLNIGALTHYSYAIRDAIECIEVPVCEVHLSDIAEREDFRKKSVISDVVRFTVKGLKQDSYTEAAKLLKGSILSQNREKPE